MTNAHSIRVESDERGFELHIDTDEGPIVVNIHGCAIELWEQVRREIGPWVREMELARATMPQPVDDDPGYALDDPKHPTYYERMVG